MKDLSIEYRMENVRVVIDGVEMKPTTVKQAEHAVRQVMTDYPDGEAVIALELVGAELQCDGGEQTSEIISNATISNENESHQGRGDQIFKTFAPNDRRQSLILTLTRFF
jgi:hypothetical protein